QTYSISGCPPLPPYGEAEHRFDWIVPEHYPVPADVEFTASVSVSPGESWAGNNEATVSAEILDLYPNDEGWPVKIMGSVKSPPLMSDLDGDGDLEIVAVAGNSILAAWNHDSADPIWRITGYEFNPFQNETGQEENEGFTVPAAADMDGDGDVEIVVDTRYELLVLDGTDGNVLHSFPHDELNYCWKHFPHSPAIGDVVPEAGTARQEIVLPVNNTLYILGMDDDGISILDSFGIKPSGPLRSILFSWVSVSDIDPHLHGSEVIVSGSGAYELGGVNDWTSLCLYSATSPGSFYSRKDWIGEDLNFNGITATGELTGSGTRVAISQRLGNPDHNPAFVVDPYNLSTPVGCVHNPSLASQKVLCCMMADWDPIVADLDVIIAPAENQCFTWDDTGLRNWFSEYADPDDDRPPFGALGDVDNANMDDLIVGTRNGIVRGYDFEGVEIDLDFPFTLPSEVYGGFVMADLDNDGYVEVVFGTMDNYLHVWELGECSPGYSPWPQCQHDAMRTGVLE
ncbi:MAG: hypothetical protein GF388_02835, partial [Candidatus Aegiribacteria sp.]|nr:hypothetical protein [Candidatus Aegiribacteria sp.]